MGNVGGFHDVEALKLVSNYTFGKSGEHTQAILNESLRSTQCILVNSFWCTAQ